MSDSGSPAALLSERPDLEPALEAVAAVDDERERWTFGDVNVDSGAFGELVSRGIVEQDDSAYRLRNPEAVRAALGHREMPQDDQQQRGNVALSLPNVERRAAALLSAAIAAVVLARTYAVGAVYRGSDIVLSGNDPYYYRYWVEQVADEANGIANVGALELLPEGVTKGEPLLITVLWRVAGVLGGTTTTIGHVLAWYPVVAAVVTACVVYLLAVGMTKDRRVGLSSVLVLAIIPGHAFRTSIGYADHHAFDYLWLGLTALGLFIVVTETRDRADLSTVRPWAGGALMGLSIAGQVLTWEAGPLLSLPVGAVILCKTLSDVKAGRSLLLTNGPVLAGVGLASALVWSAHTTLQWHTDLVAVTPWLLVAGIAGVVTTATCVHQFGGTVRQLAAIDVVVFGLAVVGVRTTFAERWAEAVARTDTLFRNDAIAETVGLFDPGSLGVLFLFGFALLMALPVMAWGSYRASQGRTEWLVACIYGWYFLLLATIQVRFVGELALFVAVFAGYAFVWLAAKVDTAGPLSPDRAAERVTATIPEPRVLAQLGVLFLLVGSLGMVQVPVKTSQVTIDDRAYQTASWTADYAAANGVTASDDYVLTQWGQNRMYNYFVNGDSRRYGYAEANYFAFLSGRDGDSWYDRFRQYGVGFVVVTDEVTYGSESIQSRLYSEYGSEMGHYRHIYSTPDGANRVFRVVPGARLVGPGRDRQTVGVETSINATGTTERYTQSVSTGSTGVYSVTVPYPGTYTVGNQTVTVSEAAVQEGETVNQFDESGTAYWTFDEGAGNTIYDRSNGHHARPRNGEWTDGVDETGIRFEGTGYANASGLEGTTETFTVSAWIRPATRSASGGILSTGKDGGSGSHTGILFDHGLSGYRNDRLGLYIGNGTASANAHSPALSLTYPATEYHHVAVVFDRGTVEWYLNGSLLGRSTVDISQVSHTGRPIRIGSEYSTYGEINTFSGSIDEIRYYERTLSDGEVETLYDRHGNGSGTE